MEAATSWLIDEEHVLQRVEDMDSQATPLQQTTQPLAAFSTHSAGVAGILRREEQLAATTDRHDLCSFLVLLIKSTVMLLFLQNQSTESVARLCREISYDVHGRGNITSFLPRLAVVIRTLEQAFADLRGLMAKAGDMVQLAERFRQALAEKAGTSEGTAWMDADMEAELISMGIASPVTKATAGALYHRELSRQVSSWCIGNANALRIPGVCMLRLRLYYERF